MSDGDGVSVFAVCLPLTGTKTQNAKRTTYPIPYLKSILVIRVVDRSGLSIPLRHEDKR